MPKPKHGYIPAGLRRPSQIEREIARARRGEALGLFAAILATMISIALFLILYAGPST